jgi:hypothetical protein
MRKAKHGASEKGEKRGSDEQAASERAHVATVCC